MAIKKQSSELSDTQIATAATAQESYSVKGIVLAQPVQFAGAMRTYFISAEGFVITRNAYGNFEVRCNRTTDYIELSFTNISVVTWQKQSQD